MEEIHPMTWISIAVSVVAMAWFLGGNPRDEKRWFQIYRAERIAMLVLALVVVLAIAGGAVFLVFRLF